MRFLIKAEIEYVEPGITSSVVARAVEDCLTSVGRCPGMSTAVVSARDYELWLLAREDLHAEAARVHAEFGADVESLVQTVCRLRVALRSAGVAAT